MSKATHRVIINARITKTTSRAKIDTIYTQAGNVPDAVFFPLTESLPAGEE